MWSYADTVRPATIGGSADLAKMWSLYRYLQEHPPKSPEDVKQRVFLDKAHTIPLLNDEDAHRIFYMWVIIHDPVKYRRFLKEKKTQKGGAIDPYSNQEFPDKLLSKIIGIIDEPIVDTFKWIGFDPEQDTTLGIATRVGYNASLLAGKLLFFLKTLEETPELGGPLWSMLFDAIDKNAPKASAALQTLTTPIAIILAPVGIGEAAELIVLIFQTILSVSVSLMHVSRGKFGSSFASLLSVVPIIGPYFTQAVHSAEHTYENWMDRREQFREIPLVGDSLADFDPLS
jgi:hypothetical protein